MEEYFTSFTVTWLPGLCQVRIVFGLLDPPADNIDDWFDRWIKPLMR
jgi:hypothetical protein